MYVVVFEITVSGPNLPAYLAYAEKLLPLLDTTEGIISVERFRSLRQADRYVSLSYWRDENAITLWRNHAEHRMAQATGRGLFFDSYMITVAEVIRRYGMQERDEAPSDSNLYLRAGNGSDF